ncbi:MAG: hypothetical protein NTV23_05650 [Propionibacteriales bacterium]|nr:hypothetical protein [Propionibacteriales bacterium]
MNPTRAVAVLVGLLAVTVLVLLGTRIFGADGSSVGDEVAAAQMAAEGNTPQQVAQEATLAFLDVDYRDMAPRIDRVLAVATGKFHDEYQAAEASLVAGAKEGQAVSTGEVRQIGIAESTTSTARVLVAADSQVSNKLIEAAKAKGQPVDDTRNYRIQVDLVLLDGRWLVRDLRFVP